LCRAVGRRYGTEGLTGAPVVDVVVRRCRNRQEMREGELWACHLVKTGGALSACVIRHNHYSLTFSTPLTASAL
jgi:hypothetical protein